MMETNKRVLLIIVFGALLIGTVFFGLKYYFLSREIHELMSTQAKVETNEKVLTFTSLFIKKVLQADKEVDFETRLSLENAVRNLEDPEIMALWRDFVGSKTEKEAQENVKKLLGVLIDKIQK
jgi:predicted MPP superfamily phosphohydrolase